MANHKVPGREAFETDLDSVTPDLPATYAQRVLEKLHLKGRFTFERHGKQIPYTPTVIHNVRKKLVVDFKVVDAMKEVVKEVQKAREKVAA